MDNIQDWCISRQIWWGHRLPVYYCKQCQANELVARSSEPVGGVIVSRIKPDKCPTCGSTDIYQDEDVLDTWFSSWLWPFATFGWPFDTQNAERRTQNEKDLKYFYPTSVLVTAPEIIFFWVARMIMSGLEFMRDIPFKDVYIHGTVRDIEGKKMSKSLGNIIDPLEIIDEYGADALRFSLISITAGGQDVFLSKERFQQGRNFANKIWNASRFIMMNLSEENIKTDLCQFYKKEDLNITNRWILSRFYSVLKETGKFIDEYKFNEAGNLLYGFFWHEFCDWYLEMIKSDIKNPHNQVVMYKILEKFLRVIHPFMPFITEEIWQLLKSVNHEPRAANRDSIMIQPWPHAQEQMIDERIELKMNTVFEIIVAIRNKRQELEIPLEKEVEVIATSENKANRELLELMSLQVRSLAKLSNLKVEAKYAHIKSSITSVIKAIHIAIPLEGVVDIEKEKSKIEERIKKTDSEIRAKEMMLGNKDFVKRAPDEIVEKERLKLRELGDILSKLKLIKDELQ